MVLDRDIISLYTDEMIALSEETRAPKRLENPDATASAVSPICGSTVTLDMTFDGDKISAIGYDVESCALGRAVMAILLKTAPGKTAKDITAAGKALEDLLDGRTENIALTGWEKLQIMAPVRDYPARHNAVLLPFATAEKLFRNKS